MDVIIRSILKDDYINLDKFYVSALIEEHKNIVSDSDIEILLKEYKKEKWIDYWFENNDGKAFIAVEGKNEIIGFLTSKYFDDDVSIIISMVLLDNKFKCELRNIFLEKIYQEYTNIKDVFIEIYENKIEEVEFFINRDFEIWETSIAPVGNKILNVYLMRKGLS